MNLILLHPEELDPSGSVLLSDARAAHVVQVLRAVAGQPVRVGVLDGPCGTGIVAAVRGGAVQLRCTFEARAPDRPAVDLLLALPRPKVLRRLWAQLAALGVGRIVLTNAERVERNYFDTHVLTPECYRPLLIEGLQQARDTRLPTVSIHRRLRVLVEDELYELCGPSLRLMAHPHTNTAIAPVVSERRDARVLLAVGPEGGWSTFEQRLLKSRGFVPVGMGGRTLRSDTACVALLTLVHHALASRRLIGSG